MAELPRKTREYILKRGDLLILIMLNKITYLLYKGHRVVRNARAWLMSVEGRPVVILSYISQRGRFLKGKEIIYVNSIKFSVRA